MLRTYPTCCTQTLGPYDDESLRSERGEKLEENAGEWNRAGPKAKHPSGTTRKSSDRRGQKRTQNNPKGPAPKATTDEATRSTTQAKTP